MKKTSAVFAAILCVCALLSSCSSAPPEGSASPEYSSSESKSLPMFTDEIKIDLSKAKLYFSTDNKSSVSSVKNGFDMLGDFCSDVIISDYIKQIGDSDDDTNVSWGGYDIKNKEFTDFLNSNSVEVESVNSDSVIMNDTDLYTFITPKTDASGNSNAADDKEENGKRVLIRSSYTYGEFADVLTVDNVTADNIKMSKLNDGEFIFLTSSVIKYNVKTKQRIDFTSIEQGVNVLNVCAYNDSVYMICDVSNKKQLRIYDSDGKLQSAVDFPDSASFDKFFVTGDYIFVGSDDVAIYKLSDGKINLVEKSDENRKLYLSGGTDNLTGAEKCPYAVFYKTHNTSDGGTNEYKLINVFDGKIYDLSFTSDDGEFMSPGYVSTDEYGNLLLAVTKNADGSELSPDVDYYKISASTIKTALEEKQ